MEQPTRKHMKINAWYEVSQCGIVYDAEMRRRELDGTAPDCVPCIQAYLKLPRLTMDQQNWGKRLLAAATA